MKLQKSSKVRPAVSVVMYLLIGGAFIAGAHYFSSDPISPLPAPKSPTSTSVVITAGAIRTATATIPQRNAPIATSTNNPKAPTKVAVPEPDPLELANDASRLLFYLANLERSKAGLPLLKYNAKLQAAANAKVSDMAGRGYFSHTSPEGYNSWHWFRLVGYSYNYAGENLGEGYDNMQQSHEAFMNSPSHRANILSPHFTEIGIDTRIGTCTNEVQCKNDYGQLVIFIAVMFGKPK